MKSKSATTELGFSTQYNDAYIQIAQSHIAVDAQNLLAFRGQTGRDAGGEACLTCPALSGNDRHDLTQAKILPVTGFGANAAI